MISMEGKSIDRLSVGDFAEASHIITEADCYAYAQITDDFNPVHFDDHFANASRIKRKIAHGMILAGYISGVIGTKLPGAGTLYESQRLDFLKPVYFGDTILVRVTVLERRLERNRVVLRTECINQHGETVLDGQALVLPQRKAIQKETQMKRLSLLLPQLGVLAELVQDGTFAVLEQCTRIRKDGALTYLENAKYLPALNDPQIRCVICTPALKEQLPSHIQGIVVTPTPKLLFFKLQNEMIGQREKVMTQIDPSASVSAQAYVAPYNVRIGKNVRIEPMAVIHENTVIEDDVLVCSGSVIGGQSYTFVREGEGGFLARDAGSTRIEKGVEICANCHVACGTLELDTTVIGAYSKLDAMVHIGHGTVIGKRVLFPAAATISGNCVIGDDTWIGVNATVSNRIEIGDHARVSLGSVVTKNVLAGQTVSGNFAIEHARFMQNLKASVASQTDGNDRPVKKDSTEE